MPVPSHRTHRSAVHLDNWRHLVAPLPIYAMVYTILCTPSGGLTIAGRSTVTTCGAISQARKSYTTLVCGRVRNNVLAEYQSLQVLGLELKIIDRSAYVVRKRRQRIEQIGDCHALRLYLSTGFEIDEVSVDLMGRSHTRCALLRCALLCVALRCAMCRRHH